MADRTHITCQEVVELVTDYLESRMAPEDVAVFEEHLDLCDGCRWYVEQMRLTIATVGRIEESDVPDEMHDSLLHAFRRRRESPS
jgi:predicted anti-sigma-YlaC factor YlaD